QTAGRGVGGTEKTMTLPDESSMEPSPSPPVEPPSDSPPWGPVTKAIVASGVLLLAAIVVWRFRFLWSPLAVAAIIAYLVSPMVGWLQRKVAIQRTTAVLLTYAVLLLVFGALSFVLGLVAA